MEIGNAKFCERKMQSLSRDETLNLLLYCVGKKELFGSLKERKDGFRRCFIVDFKPAMKSDDGKTFGSTALVSTNCLT